MLTEQQLEIAARKLCEMAKQPTDFAMPDGMTNLEYAKYALSVNADLRKSVASALQPKEPT